MKVQFSSCWWILWIKSWNQKLKCYSKRLFGSQIPSSFFFLFFSRETNSRYSERWLPVLWCRQYDCESECRSGFGEALRPEKGTVAGNFERAMTVETQKKGTLTLFFRDLRTKVPLVVSAIYVPRYPCILGWISGFGLGQVFGDMKRDLMGHHQWHHHLVMTVIKPLPPPPPPPLFLPNNHHRHYQLVTTIITLTSPSDESMPLVSTIPPPLLSHFHYHIYNSIKIHRFITS